MKKTSSTDTSCTAVISNAGCVNTKRRILSVVLLVVLLAALLACAAGCQGTASSEANDDSTVDSGENITSEGADDSSSTEADDVTSAEADDITSAEADSLDYTDIVEEYLTIILDYDSYGAEFDLALIAVESYLDGTLSLAEAEAEIDAIRATLTDYSNTQVDYTVSDELSEALQEYDILPEEFEYFASLRAYQASEYVSDLDILDNYLPYADEYEFKWEDVSIWYQIHSLAQDAYRGYYYYGSVNYWFAEWEDSLATYVQDEVIPQLTSYLPDTYVWETSQSAAEEKAMSYLDILTECMQLAAEYLGEYEEAVNN